MYPYEYKINVIFLMLDFFSNAPQRITTAQKVMVGFNLRDEIWIPGQAFIPNRNRPAGK
jgi:hypothetical protein